MGERVTFSSETLGGVDGPDGAADKGLDADSFPCGWPRVQAVCVGSERGAAKHVVPSITLQVGTGILGDANAGAWHRQVSLLASESVARERTGGSNLAPGDLGENILTRGIDLTALTVGTTLAVGTALIVVTQLGTTCQDGVFCVVVHDGSVRQGDPLVRVGQDTLGGRLS